MGVIKEAGNQELTIGAIADGEYLKRSGTTIAGSVVTGGGGDFNVDGGHADTVYNPVAAVDGGSA